MAGRQETRAAGLPDAAVYWAVIASQLADGRVAAAVRFCSAGHRRGALAHYQLGAPEGPREPLGALTQGAQQRPRSAELHAAAPCSESAADALWRPRGLGEQLGFFGGTRCLSRCALMLTRRSL